jgi:nitroreductase
MSDQPPPAALSGFVAAVEGRHSVRRFTTDPMPRDDVREMVRLATLAANAGNAQPWRFVAVDDSALLAAMRGAVEARMDEMAGWPEAEAAGPLAATRAMRGYSTFFADAPLAIAVLGLPYESHGDRLLAAHGVPREERDRLRARPDLQSVGAAVQLLVTAAHVLGYGACWMSAPVLAARRLEELLGVEEPARLVALVAAGRPAGRPAATPRLPVAEVLRFLPPEPESDCGPERP